MRARRRLARRLARQIARPVLRASVHLDVEWQAASVHRWDHDLPEDRQGRLFAARLLEDTVRQIHGLFSALPEADTLQIRVREPAPLQGTLLDGTVSRAALASCDDCPSPAMSLKLLGVRYQLCDGRLEPLG